MIVLIAILGSITADAHYEIEIPISVSAPPTSVTGVAETVVFGRTLVGAAEGEDDVVIKPTESPISCEVKDGDILISVTLNTASWPTSAPPSKACTLGTESVTVVPVFDTALMGWFVGTDTASPASTLAITRPTGLGGRKAYALDSGYSYASKTAQAKKDDDSTWAGVVCSTMDTNEGWVRGLEVAPSASAGSGYCKLGKPGTGTHTLALSISSP